MIIEYTALWRVAVKVSLQILHFASDLTPFSLALNHPQTDALACILHSWPMLPPRLDHHSSLKLEIKRRSLRFATVYRYIDTGYGVQQERSTKRRRGSYSVT